MTTKTTKWEIKYGEAIFCGDKIIYVEPSNAGSTFSPEYSSNTPLSRENLELIVKAVNFYQEYHS